MHKKSQIPFLKTIVILLILSTVLISFIILLSQSRNINVDTKKLNAQISLKSIIRNDCFSDEYGKIDIELFTEENLNKCIKNQENVGLKLRIKNLKDNKIEETIYLKKDFFNSNIPFCQATSSNIICSELKYPINLISKGIENENYELIVDIISK